jgi:phosphoribosyl-dephospho-CoA transferase
MAASAYRPHDLLHVQGAESFVPAGARPGWLGAALAAGAPLVVRRALAAPGIVPAGARGLRRNERCAGEVAAARVTSCTTPDMLARAVLAGTGPAHDGQRPVAGLPCIAALRDLAPRLSALGLDWGPAGGAGFWLASGLPVLRPTSDLDLLVRAPAPLSPALVAALGAMQATAPCRIDIQVDTGRGGFALAEYARGGKVMLKTAAGPMLLSDPWREEIPA